MHDAGATNTFFRPVAVISYAIDLALWGPWPFGFRLTNLLLHVICTWLVWRIIQNEGIGGIQALLGGALFAVHPAHVESVAWISGRTDLLCAVFMLGAWLTWRHGMRWSSLLLFALALLSKEMAIMLPVLIAIDARPRIRAAVPWFMVAAAWFIARALILGGAAPMAYELGAASFLATVCFVLARYITLMLGLTGLDAGWWETPVADLAQPLLLLAVLVLAALGWAAWRLWRPAFWLLWMVVTLAPVLALGRFGQAIMAERFVYIPSVGLCVAAAYAMRKPWHRALAACVAVIFPCVAAVRAGHWSDDIRIFSSLARSAPDAALVRANLGLALHRAGDDAGAERELGIAVEKAPGYALAHLNLGLVLEARGSNDAALHHYEKAAAADPALVAAPVNAGLLRVKLGRTGEGLAILERQVAAHPARFEPLFAFAEALDRAGHPEEAFIRAQEASLLDPFDARPHYLLGKLFYQRGDLRAAAVSMRRFLELTPRPSAWDEPARQVIQRAR